MARLEEVLGAYRAGKRIRRRSLAAEATPWVAVAGDLIIDADDLNADDWEVVPDPVESVMGRGEAERHLSMREDHQTIAWEEGTTLARDYLRLLDVAEAAELLVTKGFNLNLHIGPRAQVMVDALKAAGFLREGGEG